MAGLDNYTTDIAGLYSLRRALTSYSGSLVRIRRDSDDAETDVLPDDAGLVSLDSIVSAGGDLGTWVGANSAYATKWYDQSGNSNNANQGNTSKQPRLVSSGTVQSKDGLPTMYFYADGFTNVKTISTSSFNVFALAANYGTSGSRYSWLQANTANAYQQWSFMYWGKKASVWINAGLLQGPTVSATEIYASSAKADGTDRTVYSNGDSSTNARGKTGNYTVDIGGVSGYGLANGFISEAILYDSVLSDTDNQSIIENMEAYVPVVVGGIAINPIMAGLVGL